MLMAKFHSILLFLDCGIDDFLKKKIQYRFEVEQKMNVVVWSNPHILLWSYPYKINYYAS